MPSPVKCIMSLLWPAPPAVIATLYHSFLLPGRRLIDKSIIIIVVVIIILVYLYYFTVDPGSLSRHEHKIDFRKKNLTTLHPNEIFHRNSCCLYVFVTAHLSINLHPSESNPLLVHLSLEDLNLSDCLPEILHLLRKCSLHGEKNVLITSRVSIVTNSASKSQLVSVCKNW